MKLIRKSICGLAAALLVSAFAVSQADAQVSDTETFTVNVPAELTITAPTATVAITHDTTDANQAFPAQAWAVTQNGSVGANVTFSVSSAFTNGASKRDVGLALAIGSSDSGSGWTVTTATDQTDYANATPDETAIVSANATAAGNATFDLTVTFLDTNYSLLTTGAYSTTVTGTISAN